MIWWMVALVPVLGFMAGVLGQLFINWAQGRWPFRE